jgi:hypothetical protein
MRVEGEIRVFNKIKGLRCNNEMLRGKLKIFQNLLGYLNRKVGIKRNWEK